MLFSEISGLISSTIELTTGSAFFWDFSIDFFYNWTNNRKCFFLRFQGWILSKLDYKLEVLFSDISGLNSIKIGLQTGSVFFWDFRVECYQNWITDRKCFFLIFQGWILPKWDYTPEVPFSENSDFHQNWTKKLKWYLLYFNLRYDWLISKSGCSTEEVNFYHFGGS